MLLTVWFRNPWTLACLVTCWLFACVGQAQDGRAEARELFKRGVAAYEEGAFQVALTAFEDAYRLAPHPAVRVNMANCFEQLGRYVEAVFNFERFLQESGGAVDDEQRLEIEVALRRLRDRIGSLELELEPQRARVRIDGKAPRRTPTGGVQLKEGTYLVEVSAPGFVTEQRRVVITGGSETLERFVLSTPPVAIAASGAEIEPQALQASAGPSHALREDDAGPSTGRSPLFWVTASATAGFAVGLAVSGGLAMAAQSEFDDKVRVSNDPRRTPDERDAARVQGEDAADRAETLALVSDIFLAGAVVAGGATLLVWLSERKAERRARVRAGPMVLRSGGGGVVLGGKF